MTTTKERLAAIDTIARATGKSRAAVHASVAPTWNMNLGEAAALESAIRETPNVQPVDPERVQAAVAAAQGADELAARRNTEDLDVYRRWRATRDEDPVAAARLMNGNAQAISRGRALEADATKNEPPPDAA